jgi:signal transduction histidine kinase
MGEMKQFTAGIAHELRTPLTVLRGEAEIALMQPHGEEEYRHVLSSQLEEIDKLIRMINQMLTLARAESGDIQLQRQTVNLSDLAASLVRDMQPVARAKEIALEIDCEPDIQLSGDSGWLERMLLNLIDNAIKFTAPNGKVFVNVRSGGSAAVLKVEDTGPGIAPEALPHIFDRFFRVDPSRSGAIEGAGLGLTLVQWIVKQHGGSIGVESQPGHTVFTIQLPMSEPSSEPASTENTH